MIKNKFNYKIAVFAFALVLLMTSVLATVGVTQVDSYYDSSSNPVTGVTALLYKCATSACVNFQNNLVYGALTLNSGNTNQIQFTYPYNSLSTSLNQDYYAHYSFKQCYLPKEYPEHVWGYGVTLSYDYNFNKVTNCQAPVTSFSVENQVYAQEPLVINVKAMISGGVASAFTNLVFDYIPAGYENYYSAETKVTLNILNSTGAIVHTEDKIVNLLADTEENVQFEWVPTVVGDYSVQIKTNVTDCQCSSSVVQYSPTKDFTVLPERAKDMYYALIQNLNVAPKQGDVGDNFNFSFDVLSNYIDDSYNKNPVASKVNYQILDGTRVIYSDSFNVSAGSAFDDYQTGGFSWVATEAGSLIAKVNVSADTSDVTKSNLPESMSIDFVVNSPSPIACGCDADCGVNGFVGAPYCNNGNVFMDYVTNTCNNAGLATSACSSVTESRLNETCAYGCSAGVCLPAPLANCGNGVVETGEQCDDGVANGVVCSPNYSSSCNYCNSQCSLVSVFGGSCGDGVLDVLVEQCDDGNTINGDGCSSVCITESSNRGAKHIHNIGVKNIAYEEPETTSVNPSRFLNVNESAVVINLSSPESVKSSLLGMLPFVLVIGSILIVILLLIVFLRR